MTRILVRVDAGSHVGLGHLHRCLSLASALRRKDADCVFLTNSERAVQDRVVTLGFAVHALDSVESGSEGDWRQTLEVAEQHQCGAVVADSYRVDAGYLSRLRAGGLFVAVIDDLASLPFPCHLVINGGVQAESLPCRPSTGDTRFLLGPKYALLREEFWDVSSRTVKDEVRNVLVTMGGADGRNLTPTILEVLDPLRGEFSVTVVVGPFFNNHVEIEAVVEHSQRRIRLLQSPDSMYQLMLEADLAISGGGQTLYELAATGTPAVAVQVAENQAGNIQSLAQHGVVSPISFECREQLCAALGDEVGRLLADSERRRQMSRAGQELVDGKGAVRCATTLLKLNSSSRFV